MNEDNQTSLSDMLGDEPIDAPVPSGEADQQPVNDRQRDEHGRFVKKGDEEEGGSPPPESNIPEGALVAERRRRQEAEQRLQSLEQELQQSRNPPPPPPDIWEDPEGRLAVERSQVQRELYQQRYYMSQKLAETQHGKETVEQAINWAAERAQQDPRFNEDALSQMDPVAFAIEHYQRANAPAVSPDEFAAFQQWRQQQASPQRQALPPTLSNERNVGQRTGPAWTGPTTLADMLR